MFPQTYCVIQPLNYWTLVKTWKIFQPNCSFRSSKGEKNLMWQNQIENWFKEQEVQGEPQRDKNEVAWELLKASLTQGAIFQKAGLTFCQALLQFSTSFKYLFLLYSRPLKILPNWTDRGVIELQNQVWTTSCFWTTSNSSKLKASSDPHSPRIRYNHFYSWKGDLGLY